MKKLLITVGDELDSLYGVRFVSSFFRVKERLEVVLLHVAPRFESMDAKESLRLHEMDRILFEIYCRKGEKALEVSRQILKNNGFFDHQISSRLLCRHHGMVLDILDEAAREQCDVIILGRRGRSIFEKIFYPRISNKIFNGLHINLPVWVCKTPEWGLKDVLLGVDGSASSLRAAEHVASMILREKEHGITLFYVDDGSGHHAGDVLDSAKQQLLDKGIGEERIRSLVIQSSDAAEAVRKQARDGAYAVVAVGRHGIKYERSPSGQFASSTSMELLEILGGAALWLCE